MDDNDYCIYFFDIFQEAGKELIIHTVNVFLRLIRELQYTYTRLSIPPHALYTPAMLLRFTQSQRIKNN